jgi:hypothetical protein
MFSKISLNTMLFEHHAPIYAFSPKWFHPLEICRLKYVYFQIPHACYMSPRLTPSITFP